jgi:7-cyano-7-deazaguanine tRNA-ribosyltransferase
MEAYRFRELIDVIAAAKRALGPGVPVHLFGAGHPMIFALAAALGCDLFDSAAYALYARDGRYITSGGTWRLEEMRYLPCNCDVCRNHSAEELQKSPDRQTLLARHNIGASFAEMRLVRQHIIEGSLWELIERRCASHPRMIEALRALAKGCRELETLDRATKSTFFYLGPASASRPEVIRYQSRIGRLSLAGRVLVTDGRKPEEWAGFDHVLAWKPPFGPYPRELSEVYPFNAEVPDEPDQEAVKSAMNNLRLLMQANPTASFELRLRSPAVSGPIDVAEDKGSEGLDLMTRRGA